MTKTLQLRRVDGASSAPHSAHSFCDGYDAEAHFGSRTSKSISNRRRDDRGRRIDAAYSDGVRTLFDYLVSRPISLSLTGGCCMRSSIPESGDQIEYLRVFVGSGSAKRSSPPIQGLFYCYRAGASAMACASGNCASRKRRVFPSPNPRIRFRSRRRLSVRAVFKKRANRTTMS